MKSQFNFKTIKRYLSLAAAVFVLGACQKSYKDENPYGGPDTPLQASFTVTPVSGSANKFVITNTTPGECVGARWDLGTGGKLTMGKMTDTVFYPDAGTYTIKMQALSKKAGLYDAEPKSVTITTSDPAYGNIIIGGKMLPGDEAAWTKFHTDNNNPNAVTWTMANGKYTASGGGGWVGAGIYQAVQVQANKKYKFSAIVAGNGFSNGWLELWIGTQQPVNGSDYNAAMGATKYMACGSWPPGGWTGVDFKKSFKEDNYFTIGYDGSLYKKDGIVTFPTTGTIYICFRTGSGDANGVGNVYIKNVELRGI